MNAAALLSRHWPFANGSGRILDKFAGGIDLGSGVRTAETSDGFSMQLYADDLIGRHLLLSGKFDRSVIGVLLEQARPGDTLVDIGANIGYVSACFLHRVKDSKAICIEPQPGVVDLLRENMEQFGGRGTVIQAALGDERDELRFHVDPNNRGASRICEDGETPVSVEPANELLRSWDKVDLIKIDVEGFELPIFRSLEPELRRLKPRAILFEDQTREAAPQGEIGAILNRVDYRVYGIDKRLTRTRLVPIRWRGDCRFNDYLAVREQ